MPDAIYANARISALEAGFLGRERLRRMLEAETAEDALKVLYEVGYAGGLTAESAYGYEKLIARESELLAELMRSILPDAKISECLFLANDYHNAKLVAKAKYLKAAPDAELYLSGNIPPEEIEAAAGSDSYAFLPAEMAEAFRETDRLYLSGKLSPLAVDLAMDRKYREALAARLKGVGSKRVREYFAAEADLNNIGLTARLTRLGVTEQAARPFFMPGGTIPAEEFPPLVGKGAEELVQRFRYSPYRFAAEKAASVTEFELAADNYLLGLFRKDKYDCFGVERVVGYYVAKKSEMRNIRIIMTALLNAVDRGVAGERLRETYV